MEDVQMARKFLCLHHILRHKGKLILTDPGSTLGLGNGSILDGADRMVLIVTLIVMVTGMRNIMPRDITLDMTPIGMISTMDTMDTRKKVNMTIMTTTRDIQHIQEMAHTLNIAGLLHLQIRRAISIPKYLILHHKQMMVDMV
jgi:hypothetical protein